MLPVTLPARIRRRLSSAPALEPEVDASPGRWEGEAGAVLVLHGFTGSPQSMRPWAQTLAHAGYAVEMPLLPGHGTSVADMAECTWKQWTEAVDAAYWCLRRQHRQVAVVGLSMGGTLALHLAARREVAAVCVVNPALAPPLPFMAWAGALARVLPSVPGVRDDIAAPGIAEGAYACLPVAAAAQLHRLIRETARSLPAVTAPVQLFRSATDHVVPDSSVRALLRGLPQPPEVHRLTRSYHVATLDHDAPLIFSESLAFLERQGLPAAPGPAAPDSTDPRKG